MMRSVCAILMLLALGWSGPAFAQGPPPPARLPERVPEMVEGYAMSTPYQRWRRRVERLKGEATTEVLAAPPELEGRRQIGRTLMHFEYRNDFGIFLQGDVHVFCLPDEGWRFDREACLYLYRQASVPAPAAVWGEASNPVSRWMEENFDATAAVAAMREAGLAPGGDFWMAEEQAVLGAQPSPLPMLRENVELVQIDSAACPAMHAAVRALDQGRIGWRTDLHAVGEDQESHPPRPHAPTGVFTLNLWAGTGSVTITGSGEALWNAVSPTVNAAWECLQQRR